MNSESEDESSEPSTRPFGLFTEEVFTRQYTILKPLGQGGTTEVRLSSHRLTGTPVAVKALVKHERHWASTMSEVEIMKILNHNNIVSLLQVMETEQNIYIEVTYPGIP